jgi:hypothetical protein
VCDHATGNLEEAWGSPPPPPPSSGYGTRGSKGKAAIGVVREGSTERLREGRAATLQATRSGIAIATPRPSAQQTPPFDLRRRARARSSSGGPQGRWLREDAASQDNRRNGWTSNGWESRRMLLGEPQDAAPRREFRRMLCGLCLVHNPLRPCTGTPPSDSDWQPRAQQGAGCGWRQSAARKGGWGALALAD